jgi:hypothetical protein
MQPVSRRTVLMGTLGLAGTAVAGSALAGCASAPAGTVPAGSGSTAAATPSEAGIPRWPLTGVPLTASDDPKRAAVAVKVPDNKREHLHNGMLVQQGINDADIVFVENDGYSSLPSGEAGTRLMPVFHSKYAPRVQAVRSMRPVDAALIAPMSGIIGSTGATGWVQKYMDSFPQYFTTLSNMQAQSRYGSGAIYTTEAAFSYRLPGKPKPFWDKAVVCLPPKLATKAKTFTAGPQQAYFPWADEAEASTVSGEAATTVKVPWAKKMNWTMSYKWDAAKKNYKRYMPWGAHLIRGNVQVTTENILVILAEVTRGHIDATTAQITPGGSHPEPIYHLINGTGKFYYAHGGTYVSGTWTKGAINENITFTLADGTPLKMAPGRTFVEMPGLDSKISFS